MARRPPRAAHDLGGEGRKVPLDGIAVHVEVHVRAGRGGARDAGRAPPLELVDVGPPFVPRAAVDQVVQRPVKGGGTTAQAISVYT